MTRLSILGWYRILTAHHQWTIFQAIRYALWLARCCLTLPSFPYRTRDS